MPAQLRASSEGKHSHLPKVHRHAAFGTRCWHCKTWLHSPWEPKNFKLCSNKFQLYIQETTYYMALHWKKFLGSCQILKYCELLKYQNLPQVVHTLVEGQNFMKKSTMGEWGSNQKSLICGGMDAFLDNTFLIPTAFLWVFTGHSLVYMSSQN